MDERPRISSEPKQWNTILNKFSSWTLCCMHHSQLSLHKVSSLVRAGHSFCSEADILVRLGKNFYTHQGIMIHFLLLWFCSEWSISDQSSSKRPKALRPKLHNCKTRCHNHFIQIQGKQRRARTSGLKATVQLAALVYVYLKISAHIKFRLFAILVCQLPLGLLPGAWRRKMKHWTKLKTCTSRAACVVSTRMWQLISLPCRWRFKILLVILIFCVLLFKFAGVPWQMCVPANATMCVADSPRGFLLVSEISAQRRHYRGVSFAENESPLILVSSLDVNLVDAKLFQASKGCTWLSRRVRPAYWPF